MCTILTQTYFEAVIFYKLATCVSWAALNETKGGQSRQVSLYLQTTMLPTEVVSGADVEC